MCLVLLSATVSPALAQGYRGRYAGRASQYSRYDDLRRREYYGRRYNNRSFWERHRDKLTVAGGAGVLSRGDAQYMVAGRYAMHYELAHELQPVRTLQAWINLPAADKLGPTSYVDLPRAAATRIEKPGVTARLHVGSVAGHAGAEVAAGLAVCLGEPCRGPLPEGRAGRSSPRRPP